MATIQYARASIYINSKELFETKSVTLRTMTNSTPVNTVRGYRGETPGSCTTELSVDTAVPTTGFLLTQGVIDPNNWMQALNPNVGAIGEAAPDGVLRCNIVIPDGPTFRFEGFIIDGTFSYTAGGECSLSFNARGGFETTWQ